jgi:hypothetical protein
MQHGTVFGDVDLLAREHHGTAAFKVGALAIQQVHRLRIDRAFRPVEQKVGVGGGEFSEGDRQRKPRAWCPTWSHGDRATRRAVFRRTIDPLPAQVSWDATIGRMFPANVVAPEYRSFPSVSMRTDAAYLRQKDHWHKYQRSEN